MKELIGNVEARWLFFFAAALLPAVHVQAIVPTPAAVQEVAIPIAGATIHTGNGHVIESGVIPFAEGKITAVSKLDAGVNFSDHQVIEMAGKHSYPGFILPNTTLGLVEVTSVRATHDVLERGELNPNVRSIVAYNTDSELIPALRFNGILTAQITPRGTLVGGREALSAKDLLLEHDIPVFVDRVHGLPDSEDADVDQSFRRPAQLVAAGLTVGLGTNGRMESDRNLPFMAGTAAAYGMDREAALTMITRSNAEILGIADGVGTLEAGKDATLFVCQGHALDTRDNQLLKAFIQGRPFT